MRRPFRSPRPATVREIMMLTGVVVQRDQRMIVEGAMEFGLGIAVHVSIECGDVEHQRTGNPLGLSQHEVDPHPVVAHGRVDVRARNGKGRHPSSE